MADNFLTRTGQLAAAIETVPGTAETLDAGDVKLKCSRSESPTEMEVDRFTNEETSEDISEPADFVAGVKPAIPISVVVKSSGTVGTTPAIGIYLRGLGLKEQVVHAISVGAPSPGAFAAGSGFVTVPAAKTGIIEAARSGAGALRYIVLTGGALANNDEISDGTNQATCSGTDALYAVKYSPRSTGHETLTLQRAEKNDAGTADHDAIYRLKGAVGTGQLVIQAHRPPVLKARYQGVRSFYGDGAMFTGVSYEAGTAPLLKNGSLQINSVSVKPKEFSLDFGNDVQLEPDPTTDGGTEGYDYGRIAGRVPVITIDPYKLRADQLDDLGLLGSGALVPFAMSFGTTPQLIEIVASNCQLRGWTPSDRQGRRVAQLSLTLTTATLTDNDYAIYFR